MSENQKKTIVRFGIIFIGIALMFVVVLLQIVNLQFVEKDKGYVVADVKHEIDMELDEIKMLFAPIEKTWAESFIDLGKSTGIYDIIRQSKEDFSNTWYLGLGRVLMTLVALLLIYLAIAKEFATGTQVSVAVCQIKQGGVLGVTFSSFENICTSAISSFSSPRRFWREPICVNGSVNVTTG